MSRDTSRFSSSMVLFFLGPPERPPSVTFRKVPERDSGHLGGESAFLGFRGVPIPVGRRLKARSSPNSDKPRLYAVVRGSGLPTSRSGRRSTAAAPLSRCSLVLRGFPALSSRGRGGVSSTGAAETAFPWRSPLSDPQCFATPFVSPAVLPGVSRGPARRACVSSPRPPTAIPLARMQSYSRPSSHRWRTPS